MELRFRPPGLTRWWYPLVLVPVAAFAGLSGSMAYAYLGDVAWVASCRSVWGGTACTRAAGFWLLGAGLWAAIAAGLLGLAVQAAVSARAEQRVVGSEPALVTWCLANLVLGAASAWIGEGASYGRVPYEVSHAAYLLFVTVALLLYGLGSVYWPFLAGKWAPLAKVLTVANGVLGIIFGFAFIMSVLDPGIVST